jgi:hypothetical protein
LLCLELLLEHSEFLLMLAVVGVFPRLQTLLRLEAAYLLRVCRRGTPSYSR